MSKQEPFAIDRIAIAAEQIDALSNILLEKIPEETELLTLVNVIREKARQIGKDALADIKETKSGRVK